MGKLLTTIFFAALLVCPRWAGADYKQSGSSFGGASSLFAQTELGWFFAFSPHGAPLDLRTFDLKSDTSADILSFFVTWDQNRRLSSFVSQQGEKRAIGGDAFVALNSTEFVAISRNPAIPLIAISGDDIVALVGASVVLNTTWPSLVAAIKERERKDTYTFSASGDLVFGTTSAGSRIGVLSESILECGSAGTITLNGSDEKADSPAAPRFDDLIHLWRDLYLNPSSLRVFSIAVDKKASPPSCVATEILR